MKVIAGIVEDSIQIFFDSYLVLVQSITQQYISLFGTPTGVTDKTSGPSNLAMKYERKNKTKTTNQWKHLCNHLLVWMKALAAKVLSKINTQQNKYSDKYSALQQ